MEVINRTEFSISQIEKMAFMAAGENNWRKRTIVLREHPSDADLLVSDGITFDGSMQVLCTEKRSEWDRELEQAGHNKNRFVTN